MKISCARRTSWRARKTALPSSAAATTKLCRITTRSLRSSQTVWEERNERVVILHNFVVAAALDGNAVFRARQLVLRAQEIFIGFQLRIIFNDHEQAP